MTVEAKAIRVLLVDDHALVRRMIRNTLQSLPRREVEVIGEAADGEEGVRLASLLQPDLVVMDIGLPGINGLEATRRIKQALPAVEVVILTVHDEEIYRTAAREAGAFAYLTKAGTFPDLTSLIRGLRSEMPRRTRASAPAMSETGSQASRRNGVTDFSRPQ